MHGWLRLAAVALLVWAPGASAQPVRSELPTYLSQQDREGLRVRLASQTLPVRRVVPPPLGSVAVAPDARMGLGLCLGPGRVLTAHALAADWPLAGRAGADELTVEGPGGHRLVAAVGFTDSALGLAVLDVPGLGEAACARRELTPPGDGDAGLGTVLYAGVPGRSALAEVALLGQGLGVHGWYLAAAGDALPEGTPLFTGRGTWVTLVGASQVIEPVRTFALPPKAVRVFLEERFRWDR